MIFKNRYYCIQNPHKIFIAPKIKPSILKPKIAYQWEGYSFTFSELEGVFNIKNIKSCRKTENGDLIIQFNRASFDFDRAYALENEIFPQLSIRIDYSEEGEIIIHSLSERIFMIYLIKKIHKIELEKIQTPQVSIKKIEKVFQVSEEEVEKVNFLEDKMIIIFKTISEEHLKNILENFKEKQISCAIRRKEICIYSVEEFKNWIETQP